MLLLLLPTYLWYTLQDKKMRSVFTFPLSFFPVFGPISFVWEKTAACFPENVGKTGKPSNFQTLFAGLQNSEQEQEQNYF